MKFVKIRIRNFLSFKEEEINFSNGLYLISGWNEDRGTANGAGKSAICDAICWGLFGELPRKINMDSVVSWETSKGCEVVVVVEENDNLYTIDRKRKPNTLDFSINNVKKTGISVVETQRFIESAIGLNYRLFTNSIYFSQGSQLQFLTANDNDKKELLTELLELSVFDLASERVKERYKIVKEENLIKEGELAQKKNLIEVKNKHLGELEDISNRFEINKKGQIEEIQKYIEISEKQNTTKIDELRQKIEITKITIKKKKSEKSWSEEDKVKFIKSDLEKIYREDQEIDNQIQKKRELVSQKQEEVFNIEKDYLKLENEKRSQIYLLENQSVEIINKIKKIESNQDDTCSNCFQKVSKEVLRNEVSILSIECKNKINEIKFLKEGLENIYKQRDFLISEKKQEIKIVEEEKIGLVNQKKTLQDSKKSLENDLEIINKEVKKFEFEILGLDNIILTSERQIELLSDEFIRFLESQNNYIKKIESTVNTNIEKVKTLKQEINSLLVGKEVLEKSLIDSTDELRYWDYLKDAFGNKGIKSYVFERVINEINDKANEFLSYLFDSSIVIKLDTTSTTNKKGEYVHKFETLISLNGDVKEYGSFSGGEKRRLILAVDLAIAKIIQNRQSRSFNLMIFDEYTEGLDRIGKEKFMELLKQHYNITILMIDHETEFKNLFDYTIEVVKSNNISRIQ